MDLTAKTALITGLFTLTFMLNVPMGFLRSKATRLSLMWFLCLHAAIPVVYMGRLIFGLEIRYIPIFVVAAVAGQIWGGRMEP